MASYNGAQFIGEQLNSILSQLDAADEVIISDDGSTDDTVGVIEKFEDRRIKLIRNTGSKGIVSNIENALVRARGDVVFLSDQDDVWEANKVRAMMGYLEEYDLVVSDCRIVDQNSCEICSSYYATRNSGKGLIRNLFRNSYMGCCMAFKKTLLVKAIPFPKRVPMHDWWIGLVAETCGSRFFCPEKTGTISTPLKQPDPPWPESFGSA